MPLAVPLTFPLSFPPSFPLTGIAPDNLSNVIEGAAVDWDITKRASFPADEQQVYDLISNEILLLGANATPSTDDPDFIGTIGDSAAYLKFDGGDYCKAQANPAVFRDLHKNNNGNQAFIALAFRLGAIGTAQILFGTSSNNAHHGIVFYVDNAGDIYFIQYNGSTSSGAKPLATGLTAGTDYLFVVSFSYDGTTAATVRHWLNSTTKSENIRTILADTSDATNPFVLGANAAVFNLPWSANSRFYGLYAGPVTLDDADVVLLKNEIETRHGRTYS